jgi:hypothetical protein
MSYYASVSGRNRTAKPGRILKGQKPADLPVMLMTKCNGWPGMLRLTVTLAYLADPHSACALVRVHMSNTRGGTS